jgi:phosphoribosylamine--glycine ligase
VATQGYPGPAKAGSVIKGLDQDFGPGVVVFQAGTSAGGDGVVLAGSGRALNVCATGEDLGQARERAYGAVAMIDWPEGFHRTDIGWRALSR